ncbi:methyltransferase domain-containing protein [Actinomadura meridiana]|uniref:Protein-L-isoaspartate O-methyltransferase n=1 Tax=Actinomadura meridiana TaxID=559626 RepID=A0ABP8CHQ8_9ACTN
MTDHVWKDHAARLAETVAHRGSRWYAPIATTPRHRFVPRWWQADGDAWTVRDGMADESEWLRVAYSDRTLVTRVGTTHADHAPESGRATGRPTSSSTLPGLVVGMLRHARIADDSSVLDVGTGSGYSAGVLSAHLGDGQVTSVDIDPYLTEIAAERLAGIDRRPDIVTLDATGPLPGTYDRIVSMVSVRPIPPTWLAALKPGGRLVTTVTNTTLIITADRTADGGAVGWVERDRAGFMATRSAGDYPPADVLDAVRDLDGDTVTTGRYPVLDVVEAWDLQSMLELTAPDIQHRFEQRPDQRRTAWMFHADGSWARATGHRGDPPTVHQAGPRRLWDVLEAIRHRLNMSGELPVRGARVTINPEGTITLHRGHWSAVIAE